MSDQYRHLSLYTLTPMTGQASNAARTVAPFGVEMRMRTLIVCATGLGLSIPITALLAFFIAEAALIAMPIVTIAAYFLVERRSTEGLKLRNYQSILDRNKANRAVLNEFFVCGTKVDVSEDRLAVIVASSVPSTPSSQVRRDITELFDSPGQRYGAGRRAPRINSTKSDVRKSRKQ